MESKHIKYVSLILLAIIVVLLVIMAIYNLNRFNKNKGIASNIKAGYAKKFPAPTTTTN